MKGFYLSAGLVEDPQHQERIGSALWEFLWLISHETKDGGKVLNGAPLTAVRIAADLGRHVNTVRANLARLEKQGYIVREMGRSSIYHFRIANTKKWHHPTENCEPVEATTSQKTVSRVTENCEPASQKTVGRLTENCEPNKEDRQLDNIDSETKSGGANAPARATQLPKDFQPNEQHRRLAGQLGVVDVDSCFAAFCDHHASKRNKFADWDRAFNTWLRREVNFKHGGANGNKAEQRQASNLAANAEAKRSFGVGY